MKSSVHWFGPLSIAQAMIVNPPRLSEPDNRIRTRTLQFFLRPQMQTAGPGRCDTANRFRWTATSLFQCLRPRSINRSKSHSAHRDFLAGRVRNGLFFRTGRCCCHGNGAPASCRSFDKAQETGDGKTNGKCSFKEQSSDGTELSHILVISVPVEQ